MATVINEFFGYRLDDLSQEASSAATNEYCPFLRERCTKVLHGGLVAGVCTLKPARSEPAICCPNRLYADDYQVLRDVAAKAYIPGLPLLPGASAKQHAIATSSPAVAVWGKRWGGELPLPKRAGGGAYFVDWVLALLDSGGTLKEFVAIEVQSIDTTGTYRNGVAAARNGRSQEATTAGLNWENVNKRILPQLLYKGHVLQRESKCYKGLFFITPAPVYAKLMERLGGEGALLRYPMKASTITFMAYDLDDTSLTDGHPATLKLSREFTTDTGQVAQAFAGPGVMPAPNSYEDAISAALG